MKDIPARREELIAAALTGDLHGDEREAFDQARTADPSIDEDLEELRSAAARLDAAEITWREEAAPPSLLKRILSKTSDSDQ